MIITIQPSDIIKRCLWNEYKRFCLSDKSKDEINTLITEDQPFPISEDDAYVIGLLKVVETTNLIHRFKIHIGDLLKVRSNLFDNKLYINKNIIVNNVTNFKNRFPQSYTPNIGYKIAIDELLLHIDKVLININNMDVVEQIINDKTFIFVSSNKIKSVINS